MDEIVGACHAPGGMIFHVLNRGNARDEIFGKPAEYAAFEQVLAETQSQVFVRLLSYCLMPNRWHLVLWPLKDGDLGRFMQRLTTTHVRRWQLDRHSVYRTQNKGAIHPLIRRTDTAGSCNHNLDLFSVRAEIAP